jgi:hypothetical protein
MAKYEIPENVDYEYMSPEEAESTINKIKVDAFEDAAHPYLDSAHPQHSAFVSHMSNLCKAQVRKEGEPFDPEIERAAQAAQYEEDMQVLRQNRLVTDGEAEMDALVALGFKRDEIPFDVQPWQVESLKMERLNAEGNFRELSPMLETELKNLGLSDELRLFHSLVQDATIDPKSRAQHIELILERMYQANKKKYGGIE